MGDMIGFLVSPLSEAETSVFEADVFVAKEPEILA
jgi:hypothetical protein